MKSTGKPASLNIRSTRFIIRWLMCAYSVWIPAAALCLVGFLFFSNVLGMLSIKADGLAILYFGGAIGFAVGFMEKDLIHADFLFNLQRWRTMSTLGGVLGTAVMYFLYWVPDGSIRYSLQDYSSNVVYAIPVFLFLTFVGLFQAIELHHYVHNAWLWLLANVIGGLVFTIIALYTDSVVSVLLPWFAIGGITGGVMLWLFQTSLRDDVDHFMIQF